MNWENFWNQSAKLSKNELAQVQRKGTDSLDLTIQNIINNLNIQESDSVLDICCGNGLITKLVSERCNEIHGIDLSQELINLAKDKYPSIKFQKLKATKISQSFPLEKFDKIYLQYSFQYFDKLDEGQNVIEEMLKVLKPNGQIFIGDIPNHDRKWKYYDTFSKRFFLISSKIRGKNRMGKFWKKEEINSICNALNVTGKSLVQDKILPYSHYRFDYLIQK